MLKQIEKIQDWVDLKIRHLCGCITPEKRLVVVLVVFTLFTIASIYITLSGLYHIGRCEGQAEHLQQIEHIKRLELKIKQDSINRLKTYEYGRD